jgi:probable nitrogen fixation protein
MNLSALVQSGRVVATAPFLEEMVRQVRSLDTFGTRDAWPAERLLGAFVVTREERRRIPVIGDPDASLVARLTAFYNAIAASIEKKCGLLAVPLLNLTHEGFGRALITVGKLVVMDKTLRDVHRFGFESLADMNAEAEKILSAALANIDRHPTAAGE